MKKISFLLFILVFVTTSCRYDSYIPPGPVVDNDIPDNDIQLIMSPQKGDVYYVGDEIVINYLTFTSSSTIDIYGQKKGSIIHTIAKGVPNSGTFVWKTDDTVPRSNHYQIRLVNSNDENIYIVGEQFGIVSK
jgi:hypothetical protein